MRTMQKKSQRATAQGPLDRVRQRTSYTNIAVRKSPGNRENKVDHSKAQTTEESPEQAGTSQASRLFFIDHLRVALVILVMLHHVALVYGGIPPFYYFEPPTNDPLAGLVFLVFVLVNQAWFMGAFFLLAGYFTPGSYDRKGPGPFLKDRLLRLGIPIILFIFVLSPISSIGYYLMPSSLTGITTPLTWQAYPHLLGLGPLWFVAMLLIFSLGYAAWRMLTRNRASSSTSDSTPPSYLRMGIFILALALVSYLVRIIVPLGQEISLFGDVLSFPTIAYLPQYLGFFVIGIVASRHDWFRTWSRSTGIVGLMMAAVATVALFPIALISLLIAIENAAQQIPPFGYGTWQSAVYALWDSTFAVGMCLGLITLFRRFFNGESRFGRFLSQHSYAVYVFHIPIVVWLAYALRDIELAPLLKFGLAAIIIVPTCFAVAYIVRKIPGVSRIL
ncbi:MAG: acyltransferase family protein [Chloroflexi bacterium]|nr:acyltransferase family protein [Chloroflexota bacterium]MBU1751657.1 acyltransferase family protein [Chloroflexota bacterium]